MIPDYQTDFLYLAGSLKTMPKYSAFYARFENILVENAIPHDYLSGTKDIWARDYMPVQISKDKFMQFTYDPRYLHDKDEKINRKWQSTISDASAVCKSIGINPKSSNIKLDGGNIVKSANKIIMTDRIFSENKEIKEKEVMDTLYKRLEVDQIILIPSDPEDFTGHADGMVRFINEDTVVINQYEKVDYELMKSLKTVLKNARLECIEILYNPYRNDTNDDANGVYINYLQMKDLIIVPSFGLKEDDLAARQLSDIFPGYAIRTIDSSEIAKKGGVLNCISWNIYKA